MASVVVARALGFRFSQIEPWLFRGLDLKLDAGETVTIVGRSGRGKSTLLRVLGGLRKPTEGTVHYGGAIDPTTRVAAFMFQDARLLPWRTAAANVALGCETQQISSTARAERIERALASVGLLELAARLPHQLSGGQQQRVALARALVSGAPLLLLDEPFSALDSHTHAEMVQLLRQLATREGRAVVLVSHQLTDAAEFGGEVIDLEGTERRLLALS